MLLLALTHFGEETTTILYLRLHHQLATAFEYRRFLAEGILPTTNEISVLKFAEEGEEKVIQNSDGFFIRHLPAKLLQEINVVDTPGTNVILDRQQRLTEEYVPRADMVLFVMSADRPFTESEVNFLKYIRQWKKKVVFLVNKVSLAPPAACCCCCQV